MSKNLVFEPHSLRPEYWVSRVFEGAHKTFQPRYLVGMIRLGTGITDDVDGVGHD